MYVVVSQVTTRRRGATLASRCPSHRELTMTRPLFETVFIATACLFAAAGCSRLRHIDLPSFGVRPAASRAPSAASLASQYGCTSQQAAANWQTARLAVAGPGTPICSVIGRYGDPVSVSRSATKGMQLVSMLHRQPDGRYYNATFVYYDDTKANRQLNRPVGRWIVERVTVPR